MTQLLILTGTDPQPVRRIAATSDTAPFLLIGDHAGAAIPAALGDMGLSDADRQRHIAIDIGVADLGERLAARTGAAFISQAYSRLVVDCNRAPGHPGWMAESSDGTTVPANQGLDAAARQARQSDIYDPYHAAIAAEIARRRQAGQPCVLVSLHSFTPVMNGLARPWELGVLHAGHRDGFSRAVLAGLQASGLTIGDNEPYRMDATDYTVPRHAFAAGLPYLEIEVRQDWLVAHGERAAALLDAAMAQALPAA